MKNVDVSAERKCEISALFQKFLKDIKITEEEKAEKKFSFDLFVRSQVQYFLDDSGTGYETWCELCGRQPSNIKCT